MIKKNGLSIVGMVDNKLEPDCILYPVPVELNAVFAIKIFRSGRDQAVNLQSFILPASSCRIKKCNQTPVG